MFTMAPKSSNSNTCKGAIKLGLERPKTNEIQQVREHLIKTNIKTLSSLVGALSDDVNLYMTLLTANRYYALNVRTICFFITR